MTINEEKLMSSSGSVNCNEDFVDKGSISSTLTSIAYRCGSIRGLVGYVRKRPLLRLITRTNLDDGSAAAGWNWKAIVVDVVDPSATTQIVGTRDNNIMTLDREGE